MALVHVTINSIATLLSGRCLAHRGLHLPHPRSMSLAPCPLALSAGRRRPASNRPVQNNAFNLSGWSVTGGLSGEPYGAGAAGDSDSGRDRQTVKSPCEDGPFVAPAYCPPVRAKPLAIIRPLRLGLGACTRC